VDLTGSGQGGLEESCKYHTPSIVKISTSQRHSATQSWLRMLELKLPPQSGEELRSSGFLRSKQ